MKGKTGLVVLIVMLNLFLLSLDAFGAENSYVTKASVTYRDIQVYLDGKLIGGEEPFILNDKNIVMVPARTVAQATGKFVVWDAENNIINISVETNRSNNQEQIVKAFKPLGIRSRLVEVTYRNIQVYTGLRKISGEEPFVLNSKGVVMVPLRTIAEATGELVTWDGKNNAVYLGTIPTEHSQSQGDMAVNSQPAPKIKVDLQDMTVLRNIGPFFRQEKPFSIAAGKHSKGLGVRLTEGSAEIVIRTHGKYKSIEGWVGVDDETSNSSGAFFFSIFTDNKEVPNLIETKGGAEKIIEQTPKDYGYDYNLIDTRTDKDAGEVSEEDNIYKTTYIVNSDLFERTPILISGPIIPASYPKYINPAAVDITGALTVTIRVTWVAGTEGDSSDLTAVLADFKFVQ